MHPKPERKPNAAGAQLYVPLPRVRAQVRLYSSQGAAQGAGPLHATTYTLQQTSQAIVTESPHLQIAAHGTAAVIAATDPPGAGGSLPSLSRHAQHLPYPCEEPL